MAQLAPMMQLRARFEDKCGHPLAGGSVFAFEVGTSTPKDTYADADGTLLNTHPIKLDYRGEADIYLLSGRYRFVVYSCTGVKIYDVDNIGEWLGTVSADNVLDGNKTQHEINQEQAEKNIALSQEIASAVEVETNRAIAEEGNLGQAIQAEEQRALTAEQALQISINSENTRALAAEAALQGQINIIPTGNKAYKTYALMDADKANIPVNSKVTVTNDATSSNNGEWQWDGTTFTKSVYDPLQQSKNYTDSEVIKNRTSTLGYVDLKMEGGELSLVTGSTFSLDGYINSTGAFVASGAGYKASDYIYVEAGKPIKFSLNGGGTVSVVAYYDANKAFISNVAGNSSNIERTATLPSNAYFVRLSNLPASQPSPSCKVIYVSDVISDDDLTLEPSINLADPSLVVNDFYVNSSGGITAGVGWKHIKIPVTPDVHYSFGNFVIDSAGYYTFQTSAGAAIAGSNGSYQTGTLPRTVIAPATAGYLLFDIARPSNTPDQHAQMMCNTGDTLLPYEDPTAKITKIKNYGIAGTGGGDLPENAVEQGGDAVLGDLTVDNLTTGALIANLPTSPAGLPAGRVYIDVADGKTLKAV